LRASGLRGTVHARTCNIKDEEAVAALVADAVKVLGRVDYLVNNGGGQARAQLLQPKASSPGKSAAGDRSNPGHAWFECLLI
jgi:NAD(P)-dependent dehydrogenase (short-subunit alcohol dehydrogenase family)